MPVTRFEVERYRSFARRTAVELRPLTVLFGYNSVGKSALVRALPLLSASCGGARYGPLALDADVARGATWDDLPTRQNRLNRLDLAVTWDEREPLRAMEWRLGGDATRHWLHRVICQGRDPGLSLDLGRVGDDDDVFEVSTPSSEAVAKVRINFDGLRPEPSLRVLEGNLAEGATSLLEEAHRLTGTLRREVQWLSAVRRAPDRQMTSRGVPRQLSGDGWWAWDVLAADNATTERSLERTVAADLKGMFPHALKIDRVATDYRVQLTPSTGAPVPISVLDVGEGVVQVIPILTLLAMAERGDFGQGAVLSLEHPEMHLHPRAEVDLAKVMARVASAASGPRLLVETHSEHLLLSIQLLVAQGKLDPSKVSILWLEQEAGESLVNPLQIDPQGRVAAWPPGVFSEDVDLARELLRARREAAR